MHRKTSGNITTIAGARRVKVSLGIIWHSIPVTGQWGIWPSVSRSIMQRSYLEITGPISARSGEGSYVGVNSPSSIRIGGGGSGIVYE